MSLNSTKKFCDYDELANLLQTRGMAIEDLERAKKKISQIGYYRLSGFWYPCRTFNYDPSGKTLCEHNKPKRSNQFLPDTKFNNIFLLYKFDKRLRLLLLDAIERIEIQLRTIIAHELGRKDPITHLNQEFINPKFLNNYTKNNKGERNKWFKWIKKQTSEVLRSAEDYVRWYKEKGEELPIWVAVETWSFGTTSKYFELLKKSHQNEIAKKMGVSNSSIFVRWLQELNTLRNKCAHHTRVWNQSLRNPLGIPSTSNEKDTLYFSKFDLTEARRKKMYTLIAVVWYLVKCIGPNSDWIQHVIDEFKQLPTFPFSVYEAMGIPEQEFSIDPFV